MEGWIKLHRKFLEWEWHDSPETVSVFVHLLMLANHEEKKWHGMSIERGQLLTSRDQLSKLTGLTDRKIRTCINRLKSTSELTIKSTNKYTIITICNYDKYQVKEDLTDQQNDQQNANERPATVQPTNKNEKNNINITLTNAPAREETWRFISSVRRSVLNNNPDAIADFKRDLFRREVETNVSAAGMNTEQKEKFIGWWTEHTPGSDKIRAEYEAVFNTLDRMKIWMDRNQPKAVQGAKGRMDQLEDDLNFISNFFNGQQSSTTAPDEQ